MGPDLGLHGVLQKAAMDFCLWAPIANAFYIVAVPTIEGEVPPTHEHATALLVERFAPAMAAEFMMFVPYDLVSFSLIPPLLRPLTASCVSLCYAVFMSWWSHREVEGLLGDEPEECSVEMEGRARAGCIEPVGA